MKKALLWFIFVVLLFSGNTVEKTVLEDVQLVSIYGYDFVNKNTIKGIISSPVIPLVENTPPKSTVFAAKAHTSKNTRQKLQGESPEPLVLGRLEALLFNDKLAKHGIMPVVSTMSQDPSLGRNVHMAIVDGSVQEMLEAKYPVTDTSSQYIQDLLKHNSKNILPRYTNLHSFVDLYHNVGQDPVLPLLVHTKDRIRVKGIALFDGDKYKGFVPYADCFVFKLLYENFNNGMYEFKVNGHFVTIENLASKVKEEFINDQPSPKMIIKVRIKGKITDAPGLLLTKKQVKNIEDHLTYVLSAKGKSLVGRFQKMNIDPLGLVVKAGSQDRHLNKEKWEKEYYRTLPVDIKVETEITQSGTVE
ncbi:spore germination protein [Peribacillus deserti]|uniref:Spore germination protein n=1 Tax=Peribacillus deserti TaxID=673318 RepID=A0ABS2QL91_9BACI|nr:Ger(x)C family spore germination protein [Peribacillus deserti]MBM7693939.1 spore germination protein [Peribacillus deserti]